jgi:hypothetical protein
VEQNTDVFYGFFSGGIKPSTELYNLQRADQNHFLKYGTTLYGEWFLDGKRIPRDDGNRHSEPLPTDSVPQQNVAEAQWKQWNLTDLSTPSAPDYPELYHDFGITDGCASQVTHSPFLLDTHLLLFMIILNINMI